MKHAIYDLVYVFMVGGLIGTIYEIIYTLIRHGVLEDRSGSILTPFNYVYGLGAVIIFLVFRRVKKNGTILLLGSLLGGFVEYVFSWFQEIIFGSRSWDYSARVLNIDGRTSITCMIVWGILCFLAVHFVFPTVINLLYKIPDRTRKTIAVVFLIIISMDAVLTGTAVIRYTQRADGIFHDNTILQWIDILFHDGFMKLHFPNMRLK